MSTQVQTSSIKRSIGAAALAGIVAGLVMIIPMTQMMAMIQLPPDIFPTLIGLVMGQDPESAVMFGLALHFVPSVLIGVIFGIITTNKKLQLSSIRKGVILGIAAGIISFVVLFMSMMMTVFPPTMVHLMQMMNPDASTGMIMQQLQSMQPMILAGSFVSHIIYGIVLGSVAAAILRKTKNAS